MSGKPIDTTDQQAVTVAQDITRNPASIWLSPICDDTAHHGEGRTWAAPAPAETCEDCSKPWVEYVRSDLASVSSASAETVDWIPSNYSDTPEPVPATNQAGEVERAARAVLARWDGSSPETMVALMDGLRAALATQPATSQEGEGQLRAAAQFLSDRLDNLEWMDGDLEATLRDYMGHVDPAHARLRNALAATPTPPTLSEDLESALTDLVSWFSESGPSEYGPWIIVAGEHGADAAVVEARAALARAQVKAS
jgi:hypothetical protein